MDRLLRNSACILVLGSTYKKDVKDLRKSPPLVLIDVLQKARARVDYHDPIVPYLAINGIRLNSVPVNAQAIKKYDCVIVAVDHTDVNYDLIAKNAKLIFDIKNIYKGKSAKNIVRF